jgi:hypothetical protein
MMVSVTAGTPAAIGEESRRLQNSIDHYLLIGNKQ